MNLTAMLATTAVVWILFGSPKRGDDSGATMSRIGEVIMAKLSSRKSVHSGQFQTKPSAAEELATFRSVVTALINHPDQLRNIAAKAGITTPSGNLKKAYKG